MKSSGTQIASPSEWVKKNIIRKLREKSKEIQRNLFEEGSPLEALRGL